MTFYVKKKDSWLYLLGHDTMIDGKFIADDCESHWGHKDRAKEFHSWDEAQKTIDALQPTIVDWEFEIATKM